MKNRNRERIIVVGNGMVGHRLCEKLATSGAADRFLVTVLGEERHAAYDRVHLTDHFTSSSPDALQLADPAWYATHGFDLRLGVRGVGIARDECAIETSSGERISYDRLILATGSAPFVPRLPGADLGSVFVYRTLDDLDAIRARAETASRCVVLGGGLLGLEAARAMQGHGLETHVVELAPRLMPRQLDARGSALLEREIRGMGVTLHLGKMTRRFVGDGDVTGVEFEDGTEIACDMIVISAGIIPRDELARAAGLKIGPRGGVVVDDSLRTSDPNIYAIGEVALHGGSIYGLVAPGYAMAETVARQLAGEDARFEGADTSTKLKLMGVDVASFGDPFLAGDDVHTVVIEDEQSGVYKKLVLSGESKKLVGGILVGDAADYSRLRVISRDGAAVPARALELLTGPGGASDAAELSDDTQVCSCNNVTKGQICAAIADGGLTTFADVKRCTGAGTGCGGCTPLVNDILATELEKRGQRVDKRLCEHFERTRAELYEIVRVTGIRTFEELVTRHGRGHGCEICKPTVASIFASVAAEHIVDHANIQDTNDRFLANIQRQGLYSVVPRIPGGEIKPEKLMTLGRIAKKYGLYTKITGGQRIDLFGARLEQLPDIWEELVAEGFESGHAYAKGLRTVKSCVGTSWCRYGVGDSVGLAIRIEHRYKGIRAPHKLKSAVSGCVRECAEAQSKDFGIISTEKGWNLYVGGNGGAKPRHADLLAADLDEETLIRSIDRFLMYYIKTADRLTRTSTWIEKLEGGIDHVRDVVMNDSLGLGAELEAQMQQLVERYRCEWTEVVKSPKKCASFRHFAGSVAADPNVSFRIERGQRRPDDWTRTPPSAPGARVYLPILDRRWVGLCDTALVPKDGGVAVNYGDSQLAVYHYASTDTYYVTQNHCPHTRDQVLARGLLGERAGEPKVACPQHKKTFSLETGECTSGEDYAIATFPVRVTDGRIYAELPPAQELAACLGQDHCHADAAE